MSNPVVAGVLAATLALADFSHAGARNTGPVDGAVLIENSPAEAWAVVFPLGGNAGTSSPVALGPGVPTPLEFPADGDALVCGGADGCATTCTVIREAAGLARLRLLNGARVRGRCLMGRLPVRDARVFLRPAFLESRRPLALPLFRGRKGELVTSVTTDASGAFELGHVAPGAYVAEVHLRDGRIHESEALVVDGDRDDDSPVDIELPPIAIPEGLRTVVQVRGRDGSPIAGAGVGLLQRRGEATVFVAETRTDAHGVADVSGLVAGVPVYTTCSARGFARLEQRFPAPPATQDCVLERFGTVSGSVAANDGTPLPATVSLVRDGQTADARTDGRFRLSGVRSGSDELRVAAPGYRVALREIVVEEGHDTDVGALTLAKADAFIGRAVDAESRAPVHGAAVRVVDPVLSGAVFTDQDGRFSVLVDLAHGARLEAAAAGYATAIQDIAAAATAAPEGAVIPLERPGTLEVMVWSDEGDLPCIGCTVTISARSNVRSERTDASGVVRFSGLSPGVYHVTREHVTAGAAIVQVSGGGTGRMVAVKPRETARVELGSKSRVIEIALSPPPAADCRITAIAANSTVWGERNPGTGAYRLAIRPGEAYRLQLGCGGGGVRVGALPAEYQGTLLTLDLAASSLIGSVTAGGEPVAGREVMLRSVPDDSLVAWSVTQPDGRFALLYLPPGMYSLLPSGGARPLLVLVAGPVTDVGRVALGAP